MKEAEMQGRARFEQWGVMHDMLKRYQMTWSDALGTYYNGYWQRAWESWQAGAREELLNAAKEIEPDPKMMPWENTDFTHAYKVGFADALQAVERRAGK